MSISSSVKLMIFCTAALVARPSHAADLSGNYIAQIATTPRRAPVRPRLAQGRRQNRQ